MVFLFYEKVIVSSSGHVLDGRRLRKSGRGIDVDTQGFRDGVGWKPKAPEFQSPSGTPQPAVKFTKRSKDLKAFTSTEYSRHR